MAAKTKSKTRKSSPKKKAAKKAVKKKALKKKSAVREKAARKKTAAKKTARKKPARKRTAAPKLPKETISIEPGPPSLTVPPVEEPASNEVAVGTVTHYYSHLGVAVVQINKGVIRIGDTVHMKGHTTDFTQKVESMEYEHQHTELASAGQSVGLKVVDHTREHDILFLVK